MNLNLQQGIQNHGPSSPISYKPDVTVKNKLESNSDSLKVDIKTHKGYVGSEPPLYIPMFKQYPPGSWLKFQIKLQKIIKVQILKAGPQWYAIIKNLQVAEDLRVFEQQERAIGIKMKEN